MIIAGQGTAALEFIEQAPELDALITPIGGGGLLSGCAVAAKGVNPKIRVFGAEPQGANDTYLSFRKGERVEVNPDTIADGLRSPTPGKLTFPIIRELAEDVLLVTEDEIREAMKFLLTRMKILVEPSGAVPAAAVLFGKLPKGINQVGIVLSGGNVDFEQLASI
jgi:threonine dehydratase